MYDVFKLKQKPLVSMIIQTYFSAVEVESPADDGQLDLF